MNQNPFQSVGDTARQFAETPFQPPQRVAPYSFGEERATYRIDCRGTVRDESYFHDPERRSYLKIMTGCELPRPFPYRFNAAVRRQPGLVIHGDLPGGVLAELEALPENKPPFLARGEVRLRLRCAGVDAWLDERGAVETVFHPWGAEHRCDPEVGAPLTVATRVMLVGTRGMLLEATVSGEEAQPVAGELSLWVGSLGVHEAHDWVEYIHPRPGDEADNALRIEGHRLLLADAKIPGESIAESDAAMPPEIVEGRDGVLRRGVFRLPFDTSAGPARIRLLLQYTRPGETADLRLSDVDALVGAAEAHYADIFAGARLTTPDPILDGGFDAALMSLESCRHLDAWAEGIHEWLSFFSCNYPISAATALGRPEQAAAALRFFSADPDGPGAVYLADGQSTAVRWGGVADATGKLRSQHHDGLPYHIVQLHRYWRATDDLDTLRAVWEGTVENLERNLAIDDTLGNGLLYHHHGCNCFLYQFDNLHLPGAALSPSAMAAGCLDRMAELAEALGETDRPRDWRRRAAHIRREILRLLWLPEQGRFAAALDPQFLHMQARAYTDDCFPALYSGLPAEECWLALKACRRDLWTADHLMRVADYQPEMFGNSLPQPCQSAEAAEAYAISGESDLAWALLHDAGRSSTLLTDSPGATCEFQTVTGFGVPDWHFAQPAGAYIQAVAGGLFGLERRHDGALVWQPSIPASWGTAELTLNGITATISGTAEKRTFALSMTAPQGVSLRLPRYDRKVSELRTASGADLPYRLVGHPAGGWIELDLPPAARHEVHLRLGANESALSLPDAVEPGSAVAWTLPATGWRWRDPQGLLRDAREENGKLLGRCASRQGEGCLFLVSPDGARVVPHRLQLGAPSHHPLGPLVLAGARHPVSLDGLRNSDAVLQKNMWRCVETVFDVGSLCEPSPEGPRLAIAPYRFTVAASSPRLIRLDAGGYHGFTGKLTLPVGGWDDRCVIAIGRHVAGLEFLVAADAPARVTGMAVAEIRLHYSDGGTAILPLTWGGELGSSTIPFGTRCVHRELQHTVHVCAFAVPAEAGRRLESLEVRCAVADFNFGILAVNAVDAEACVRREHGAPGKTGL